MCLAVLKDITTLFLDTGIGSNSYAIIALGMVDDILNDKDNARRKMFEQRRVFPNTRLENERL